MLCPIDGETLVMTDRSGVEIDYCPKCRGVWLDRGELDKILERAAAQPAAAPAPAQPYPAQPSPGQPYPSQTFPEQMGRPVSQGGYQRRDDDDDDDNRYKKKRRGGLLGELFDF